MGYYLANYPVAEFPRITHFGYCDGEQGRNIARHYHLGFEIVYLKRGDVRVDTIPNKPPVRLNNDSVFIMPPLVEHSFRIKPADVEYYWIGIQTDADIGVSDDHRIPPRALIHADSSAVTHLVPDRKYEELLKLGALLPRDSFTLIERFPQVSSTFADLYTEISNEHPMRLFLIYAKVIELFSLIYRRIGASPHSVHSRETNMVTDHINAHYREDLSLDVLARFVGFHPSYLSRLFQRETGQKISAYIREVRLAKAKQLLVEGEPVAFVAKACGFHSIYAFSATFKRTIGVSPTDYRKTPPRNGE